MSQCCLPMLVFLSIRTYRNGFIVEFKYPNQLGSVLRKDTNTLHDEKRPPTRHDWKLIVKTAMILAT